MEKKVAKLKEFLELQGQNGNWNYDPYMHGMYNGMEYTLSFLEDREPVFREAPDKWLSAYPNELSNEPIAITWDYLISKNPIK